MKVYRSDGRLKQDPTVITGAQPIAISAGTQSVSTGTIVFSNSNGMSFGMSNSSVITGAYSVPLASNAIQPVGSATGSGTNTSRFAPDDHVHEGIFSMGVSTDGNTLGDTRVGPGRFVFQGGPNITLSQITAAGALNTLVFSGGAGGAGETRLTAYAVSNTTQSTSGTIPLSVVSFHGAGGVSVGISNGSVVISGGAGGGGNTGSLSAGTTRGTLGEIVFSNSNGVSFGMNGQTMTASIATSLTAINVSAGTTSNNLSAITFANSNGITFGLNASTITASHNGITSQSNQSGGIYAVGDTTGQSSSSTYDARSLSIHGTGVSVGWSNGSLRLSVTQSNQAVSGSNGSFTFQTVTFGNSNGLSFYTTNGSMVGSYTVPAVPPETPFGISAGTQSVSTGTLVFSNSNGISFGMSGSSRITASYTVPVVSNAIQAVGSATGSGTNTSRFAADDHVHEGVFSMGVSTGGNTVGDTRVGAGRFVIQGGPNITASQITAAGGLNTIVLSGGAGAAGNTGYISAGANTASLGTVVFSNSNGVSFGVNGQTVTASHNGITNINVSAGTTSNNLSAITFANSNGVSFGLNASTVTASVGGSYSMVQWPNDPWRTNFTISNASGSWQHFRPMGRMTATQLHLMLSMSGASNSSGALTISVGIYTMSGSTMSLASSDSRQVSWTSGSETSASSRYGGQSGARYRTVSLNNWAITDGEYMVMAWFRTTNNGTWRAYGRQGANVVGALDAVETRHWLDGHSTSSFTTAMPNSINVTNTEYVRSGANAQQQVGMILLGAI